MDHRTVLEEAPECFRAIALDGFVHACDYVLTAPCEAHIERIDASCGWGVEADESLEQPDAEVEREPAGCDGWIHHMRRRRCR